ncbi:MAG: HIT domain-containing protein [Bacteroidetes bacterium]|nr:HIT domain-containing protein [Bacteroidota bacterium]
MKYEDLRSFIEKKMRMSHIYQPLLIKILVDSGGSATVRQLALCFLGYDESQIRYYESTLKSMPIKVLSKHGIIKKDGDLVTLEVSKLTFEQKAELKKICEGKIQDYISKRGLSVWDYRLIDTEPVPDSLRFIVLKESKGRCALCGATRNERVLDVDHILPRSLGGKTEYANLQVLCSKCNRSKRNKDKTDFRNLIKDSFNNDCPFCIVHKTEKVLHENELAFAILDKHPVTAGHTLVIPRRHVTNYFELSQYELVACHDLIKFIERSLQEEDKTIDGFNIGLNNGEVAGQTIDHLHFHLIPRRKGDVDNPRGGVRGVIPNKMNY